MEEGIAAMSRFNNGGRTCQVPIYNNAAMLATNKNVVKEKRREVMAEMLALTMEEGHGTYNNAMLATNKNVVKEKRREVMAEMLAPTMEEGHGIFNNAMLATKML
jgi:hypothetical protein